MFDRTKQSRRAILLDAIVAAALVLGSAGALVGGTYTILRDAARLVAAVSRSGGSGSNEALLTITAPPAPANDEPSSL